MVTDNYCQIAITLSGILLNFSLENTQYNKYNTGTGELLICSDTSPQIIKLSSSNCMTEKLIEKINKKVELSGFIRNYRRDDERFNTVQVYSVTEVTDETHNTNEVTAQGETIGVTIIKDKIFVDSIRAIQLQLLTHEKYDKHTRLKAVIFSNANKLLSTTELPVVGKRYTITGYIQAGKLCRKPIVVNGKQIVARTGEIELVVLSIAEITAKEEKEHDSKESNRD